MGADNPFFHRGAIRHIEDFVGREAEINQILGLLRNGQSVSLIGPRRIGKSSLLLHLCQLTVRSSFRLNESDYLFIMLDCQELAGSPPEEVYELLLSGLLEAAEHAGLGLEMTTEPGTYRALDRALQKVHQRGTAVVVLLDEFELLAANRHLSPYFFARLRGLTTKYGLAFLTASQRPLFAITAEEAVLSSPFFNIFVTLPLGLFSEVEARELFRQRLTQTSVKLSPKMVNYLIELAGLHPFFLHIAGYHAIQAVINEDIKADDSLNIAERDFSLLDHPVEIEAESHLSYLWQNLTPEEQHVLAIADGPIESLRQLEQQCLLQRVDEKYYYSSEILRRFVRRQDVPGLVQAGPFVIDEQRHQVWGNGRELSLTTSQFSILVRMCLHAGQVVRGEDLELTVWGDVLVDDPDRLKTLIKRLRRAIDPYGNWIVSERGVGYALRAPEE
ncbi:MAG: winged helix-turn-helix domain-containing protein [Candidatus Promineofilum sp.]|nr:winged helix-turn-helix domain-containing protein [Promineifilum sp.]MBP9657397.1 winged helix-turn-helix domain-containing protein [Promineifilum sp.]